MGAHKLPPAGAHADGHDPVASAATYEAHVPAVERGGPTGREKPPTQAVGHIKLASVGWQQWKRIALNPMTAAG